MQFLPRLRKVSVFPNSCYSSIVIQQTAVSYPQTWIALAGRKRNKWTENTPIFEFPRMIVPFVTNWHGVKCFDHTKPLPLTDARKQGVKTSEHLHPTEFSDSAADPCFLTIRLVHPSLHPHVAYYSCVTITAKIIRCRCRENPFRKIDEATRIGMNSTAH